MEKIPSITLKQNFTRNTLGCYELISALGHKGVILL